MTRHRSQIRAMKSLTGITIREGMPAEEFCQKLALERGQHIHLIPMTAPLLARIPASMRRVLTGVWIALPDADHIFYPTDTSPVHQENAIMHEVGHMLKGHCGTGQLNDLRKTLLELLVTALLPNLSPALLQRTILRVKGRTGYTAHQEEEAEQFAEDYADITGGVLQSYQRALTEDEVAIVNRLAILLGSTAGNVHE